MWCHRLGSHVRSDRLARGSVDFWGDGLRLLGPYVGRNSSGNRWFGLEFLRRFGLRRHPDAAGRLRLLEGHLEAWGGRRCLGLGSFDGLLAHLEALGGGEVHHPLVLRRGEASPGIGGGVGWCHLSGWSRRGLAWARSLLGHLSGLRRHRFWMVDVCRWKCVGKSVLVKSFW